ncbi:MAG: TonB-dependent receptor, partial [Bryobacteraceae bacterium]
MKTRIAMLPGILLLTAALWGQADANKGQIGGTVFDPKQSVVPNAKVQLRNVNTGFVRQLTTSETGLYRAVLLDPGTYEITAESSGFAQSKLEGVQLNVGSSLTLDIVLQLEATSTIVEISSSMMNTGLPAPTKIIDTNAIANLPINGRRFQDFATLTPTVQVDPQRGQLSFAGQKGIYSNIMLDGADYNQPFFGGIRGGERSNFSFTIPQGAVQEFQIVTTGYSAEYGRSTGGVMNTITKSGTNEFHGDAFYQLRHKEMSRRNPVLNVQPTETLQQFGGNIGGPIARDKTFIFGAIERQQSTVPRTVLFTRLINLAPIADTQEAYNFYKSQEGPYKQTNDATALTVRGDHQTAAGHRLTMRYNFSDNTAENGVGVGGSLNPISNGALSNEGTEKDRTHSGTAQYTHLFSPNLLNDIRFTGTYEIRPRLSNSALPRVQTVIGFYGAQTFLPTVQDDLRWQITDGLSLTRGPHTLKFGVDYSRITTFQEFGFNQFGSFSVSGSVENPHLELLSRGGATPNRFDSSTVTYFRQVGNLLAEYGVHQFALYGQNNWRATNRLTLDFGVRYEGQWNPEPEVDNTALVNTVRSTAYPLGSVVDPARIPDSPFQLMPRFGFAWTPGTGSHRTVVRGHTGIFYAATPLLVVAGPTNNFRLPPGDVSISLTPALGGGQTVYRQLLNAGVDLNNFTLDNLPIIPIETVQRAAQLAAGGVARDPFTGVNVLAMAADYKNPRSFQAGLGFDSEVFRNFIAGVQLNYVNSVHLLRNRDYNLPFPVLRASDRSNRPFFGLRSTGRRPVTTLGDVLVRESSARAMYRGMTFSGNYRRRAVQLGFTYTVSDTFSEEDAERDATGFRMDNSFDLKPEY